MSVVMRFTAPDLTKSKYEEIDRRLNEAGLGSPAGRLYHVCFGDKNNLRVSDIWDSRESFEQFMVTLTPILEQLGVHGQAEFFEVHNIIEGRRAVSAAN